MKKRLLSLFLALAMVVCMLPFAVFADGCAHSKTHHEVDAATCVAGADKVVCDDCGTVISTSILQPVEEHLFVPNINNGNCLKCGGGKDPCAHEDYIVQDEEPATCSMKGYIWKYCNICGEEFNHETPYNENVHEQFTNGQCVCGFVCPHEKTHIDSVQPNCAEIGYNKVICELCAKVLSEETLEKTNEHTFLPNYKDGKACLRCDADKQSVCEHEYKITREEEATCTVEGYVWKECELCGKETNGPTPIDANVHINFVNGICAGCDYECPHEKTYTDSVQPNCAEAGYSKVICELCTKVLTEETLEKTNEHTFLPNHEEGKICVRCNANRQDVCEHDYKIVRAEAGTCSLKGHVWKECKQCGHEYNHETDIIPSAHNFVNGKCAACFKPCQCDMEYQDIKMSSCKEEGYIKIRCIKCDKVLHETILKKSNEHLFLPQYENGTKCQLCNADKQSVCEHNYEIVKEQAGTCIEAGYVWKECALCGKEYNHETEQDPDGHDYMITDQKEATCEEPAHVWKRCVLCAYKTDHDEGEAAGHKFANGKCSVCGDPDPDCPHTNHVEDETQYRAPTCTVDGVRVYDCPACGMEQRENIPMLGHTCVESISAPTCTENGTRYINCTSCKTLLDTEVIPATGHTYVGGSCACGASDPNACVHPQNMRSTHTEAATCTMDGYTIVTCNACDAVLSRQNHNAIGHTEQTIETAATCTQKGSRTVICTTCHTQLRHEFLNKIDHNYVNDRCSACGKANPEKFTSDFQNIHIVGGPAY